jgi:20S proteasome subunit beta 3
MSDIFSYNGGSIVAMKGKNCVGVACDRRFGQQMQTITTNFQRVFKMQDNIFLALGGLGTDIHTL